MNYAAVLFDMDGVLVNSERLHAMAFREALKLTLSDLEYRKIFGKTDKEGARQFFARLEKMVDLDEFVHRKSQAYLALAHDQVTAYPGVIDFIADLHAQGTPLALVTGSLRAEVAVTLKALGLSAFFPVVVTAEDVTHSKSHPEGYLRGAKALGVDPTQCVAIEDSPAGIKAANAAGMRSVAVTTTHAAAELKHAHYIVPQLSPGCLTVLNL